MQLRENNHNQLIYINCLDLKNIIISVLHNGRIRNSYCRRVASCLAEEKRNICSGFQLPFLPRWVVHGYPSNVIEFYFLFSL